jgi:energy-coupling factor transport system ATP-binding protein
LSAVAEPLVEMGAFTYRYPGASRDALAGVDLELDAGELVLLAGRSGSGKSTLLRALCGLVPHYHGGDVAGRLSVCGLDVREHGPAELGGYVGFTGQDPETQVVSTTVMGELTLPLELRGEPPSVRARAVEEAALALGIGSLLDRTTDTLSGGEQQRVALAATLVLRPRLVLLDEPTSQLDPVAGDELIGLLRRLNEEWGLAVLLAEHRLERCLAAADRVVAIDGGRVAFDGRPGPFLDWALGSDPALATPGARLFDLAGLSPPPTSVKAARESLAGAYGLPGPVTGPSPPTPDAKRRRSAELFGDAKRRISPELFPVLSVRDLWVALDAGDGVRDVLRGVSLVVGAGETVALMGRNGAGKTTLLRALAGLVEPVRGDVRTERGCVLLPQAPGDLFVRERVGEELPSAEGLAVLRAVDLEWAVDADPRDLSGGERQRLALAIVMAGRAGDGIPGAICLDEPTRGMDPARKRELGEWIIGLAQRGAGVLVATHDVEFAARFAERIVLLSDGGPLADGPADEVLSGGWYFATEVARILGEGGAITPEQGAAIVARARDEVPVDAEVPAGSGRGPSPATADAKRSSRGSHSI